MKTKEMDKIKKHFDKYFEQTDAMVMHPIVDNGFHVDVLLYKPNDKYPFWKLVTMGQAIIKCRPCPIQFLNTMNTLCLFTLMKIWKIKRLQVGISTSW